MCGRLSYILFYECNGKVLNKKLQEDSHIAYFLYKHMNNVCVCEEISFIGSAFKKYVSLLLNNVYLISIMALQDESRVNMEKSSKNINKY